MTTAGIIIIGNEILSGKVTDKNSPYLCRELRILGVEVKQIITIPDVPEIIGKTALEFSKRFTWVFTSGGIGPTHDDVTSECMAEAFNCPIEINKDAKNKLEDYYRELGKIFNSARMRMARIPKGAKLIENSVSAAPGYSIGNVHVMAGIPKVFQAMVSSILKTLKKGTPTLSRTLKFFIAESEIATLLEKLSKDHPKLSIGSYPFDINNKFGVNIVVRGDSSELIDQFVKKLEAKIDEINLPE